MAKSLLDIVKEKGGEKFDITTVDFSTALMERVAMNRSAFGSMEKSDDVLVGYEAEWGSESLKPEESEWQRIGSSPDNADLDDARDHSQWDERHFSEQYQEYKDEARDNFRDQNHGEIGEYCYDSLADSYEDDVLDDEDAMQEITSGSIESFLDELRANEGWDEDDDDYKDPPMSDQRAYLRSHYGSDFERYLQFNYDSEWAELEDKYMDRNFDGDDEDDYFNNHSSELLSYMGMDSDDFDDNITDDMMKGLADKLWSSADIEIKGYSSDYDGSEKRENGYDGYYLETDNNDAELVSPPQPVGKTLADLENVLNFIQKDGGAKDSNGLHVSLSVKGKTTQDYDPLKILMFLGEDYLLKAFNRSSNTYAHSHSKKLKTHTELLGMIDEKAELQDPATLVKWVMNNQVDKLHLDNFIGYLVHQMTSDRYRSFNLQHMVGNHIPARTSSNDAYTSADTPYIEFRIMGNEGYEKKFETIKDTILRYAYVMKLATDPTAEREEYAKKLYRFFSMLIGESQKMHGRTPDSISNTNHKVITPFFNAFEKDFVRGNAMFKLGKRNMNVQAAKGYLSRILKNQIEPWMYEKVHETWMIVAVMLSASEFDGNNIDIKDYTTGLKIICSRMRINRNNFRTIAAGALITDDYYVSGQPLTEDQFATWMEQKAIELKLI